MGIDWLRMRPRQGIARADVMALIEIQAASFQALLQFWEVSPRAFFDAEASAQAERLYRDQYRASSRALEQALEFGEDTQAFSVGWRVYPITRNPLFPPEWRLRAYRTYLPDELPEQLAQWKRYIGALEQGKYRGYLFALYLYEASLELYEQWAALAESANAARQKTTAWATKPAFLAACEQIERLEPPTLHPAPLWSTWQDASASYPPEYEGRYHQYQQQLEAIGRARQNWNAHVRGNWKLGRLRPVSFEQFLARANDSWLTDFFAWADHCCAEQMGLFLDY